MENDGKKKIERWKRKMGKNVEKIHVFYKYFINLTIIAYILRVI